MPDHVTIPKDAHAAGTAIDLSVVIVNYNVRDFLEQALHSVQRAALMVSAEVFVVDNNSVDGSVQMVRETFPDVELIANVSNVGFGAANNMAIERSRGRYVLILNPDTIVQEDTFQRMVSFMDRHPEAGAVGCQILNPDGTFAPESRRSFPTPQVGFYRISGLGRLFPKSPRFGRYNMTFLPRDQVAEVDALSGSCMMVRAEAVVPSRGGVGLFDEDFFMYGEDLDLCYRIQKAGWKIFYSPDTQIIHYKGESTKKGEIRYVRLFYGAMVLFTRKHLTGRYSMVFAGVLQAAIMVRAGLSVLSRATAYIARPALDFALVYLTVALLAWMRSRQLESPLSPLYLTAVAPAFGAGTLLGIALTKGYRPSSRHRIRPALLGVLLGFLVVSAVSFFAKAIAFSRAVVLVCLPVAAMLLAISRLLWTAKRSEPRRAIVVGDREEAERLAALIGSHPRPPFLLDGYVEPADGTAVPGPGGSGMHLLGAIHHLRDVVRLHRVDDVVFAVKNLPNQRIMSLMQSLRDLPVQFRMLGEDRSHVIGKASISELGLPDWSEALSDAVTLRTRASRKTFEIPVALALLLLFPLLSLGKLIAGPEGRVSLLARAAAGAPSVILGRRDLVGLDPSHESLVPADWRLRPGLFNITQLVRKSRVHSPLENDVIRAYWYYVTHQSASLDAEVIFRVLADR
ncbi:MAG: GT2 family glycosyltransferase [Rhodothermales bacterium]